MNDYPNGVRNGMFSHLKLQTVAGTVLTVVGLVGMLISFQVPKSDIESHSPDDSVCRPFSVSIIGISLIIENTEPQPKSSASESNNKLNELPVSLHHSLFILNNNPTGAFGEFKARKRTTVRKRENDEDTTNQMACTLHHQLEPEKAA